MPDQDVTSLGLEVAEYLRFKSKRLTAASERGYRACLRELVTYFPTSVIDDFEPPDGTRMVEEFMTALWGDRAPRTYNKNLSTVHDFFVWQVRRGRLHGDPCLSIERAKPRQVHRTTFSVEQRQAILAANTGLRERLALRLLLDYGIRKGALQRVQLEHFDLATRRLVVFTKGQKVHRLPIPDDAFWADLEQLLAEPGTRPAHFLIHRQRVVTRRRRAESLVDALSERLAETAAAARALESETGAAAELLEHVLAAEQLVTRARPATDVITRSDPEEPMGEHGLHDWWYRCLARAGIVPEGTTRGERMHKARHTAGQRVLNATGNLKAVQKLLGHATINTTADEYTDWDLDQLEDTLREVIDRR